ncbi:uncharacterized protein LOC142351456 isoform X2 [Convolutriloba macropyga]|uniref:uncharacterized protein LOC142351456 isoform X2 n=1 Tax=Convolutriloba macropyga TaxID=536237 RepID=UPI003F51DDEC
MIARSKLSLLTVILLWSQQLIVTGQKTSTSRPKDGYLVAYPNRWMLNCRDYDCLCFMIPYIPKPFVMNNDTVVSFADPQALFGTSGALRANGVKLSENCRYLSHVTSKIENSYCDVVGDMDTSLELGKAAEQMNDCQKMWADLQHELDHILDENPEKNVILFYQPAPALYSILWPYRNAMTVSSKSQRLRTLPVKYDPVGQIEVLLGVMSATRLLRMNMVTSTYSPRFYAAIRSQMKILTSVRYHKEYFDNYLAEVLAKGGTYERAQNTADSYMYKEFTMNLPLIAQRNFFNRTTPDAIWRAGQSLIDMVKKQKMQTGKASMWDNSRFPGVWFLPYGWYSTQGGNTFNEDVYRFGLYELYNKTILNASFPVGLQIIENCTYDFDNTTHVITLNSLMTIKKFLRKSPDSLISSHIVDPQLFAMLRTQILTSNTPNDPTDNITLFDVKGISAVITACKLTVSLCYAEVYPLDSKDFITNQTDSIAYKISKHPRIQKIAEWLNRTDHTVRDVECKMWCSQDEDHSQVSYEPPEFHLEGQCRLCITCPKHYRKLSVRNKDCVPCRVGQLADYKRQHRDPETCYTPEAKDANQLFLDKSTTFDMYWIAAISIGIFILLSCILLGMACLKSFDKFEAVFDVFYDYLAWHWVCLWLICGSPLFSLMPLTNASCQWNFVLSTVAKASIPAVHFCRNVQSWVHLHRQKSIRKAEMVAEVNQKVYLSPSEARKIKSCRIPSLYDSAGFRAMFIILCLLATAFIGGAITHQLVFPYYFQIGCRYLDAIKDQTVRACYESDETYIYLLSYIPALVLMLGTIILWRITALINIPPSEPCMFGVAAIIQLLIIIPIAMLVSMSHLDMGMFVIVTNLLYPVVACVVWVVIFAWKMALCNPTIAEKYPGWAMAFSNANDDIDRFRYCSCPDPHLKKTLKAVLWENFGRDSEGSKGAKEMMNVEEDATIRQGSLRHSIFMTGTAASHHRQSGTGTFHQGGMGPGETRAGSITGGGGAGSFTMRGGSGTQMQTETDV